MDLGRRLVDLAVLVRVMLLHRRLVDRLQSGGRSLLLQVMRRGGATPKLAAGNQILIRRTLTPRPSALDGDRQVPWSSIKL